MNCPRCLAPNPTRAKFCSNCGSPLEPARRVEGERKFLTILFADVVNSTAIGEQLDPEQVLEIMNGAFAVLNAAVAKYGGTTTRLLGDAILAFFGAPLAHEDDAERAVRAGLQIQERVRDYAHIVRQKFGIDFEVRVGIHSGLVVLAMVGDEIKAEYTAMGDTTNIAARLQHAALPGSVLISASTYRLVQPQFKVRPRGALELKGKSVPIETYEVLAAQETPGRVRGLPEVSSPLVGRAAELHLLRERLARVQRGEGAFIAMIGDAGLGKSRLLAELRTLVDPAAVTWLEGRGISYGQAISYYPWQQMLRRSLGVHEQASRASVRAALQAWAAAQELPARDLPFLEALLAVESEETQDAVKALEGERLLHAIGEAVRGYLGLTARAQPTIVAFDDLHWADEASLELLSSTCSLVKQMPLLMIGALRAERDAASWAYVEHLRQALDDHFFEITLDPLTPANAQELLSNLIAVEELPEHVRDLLLKKAEGNPFFLEEVIRALIDTRHILRENNHWHVTREIADVAIPDTLAGVLASRIDRLPGDTKRVVQMAAVIGRIFAYRVLKTLCATGPAEERIEAPDPHLETLLHAQLVREHARQPELEYIFKHALTQQAAYDSLLLSRRKEFHCRVGTVLEALYEEQTDEVAPTLVHHFWHGEEWERAADYAMRAGARAMQAYALRQAFDHYRRAWEALEQLPVPPAEKLVDAILAWAAVAYKLKAYHHTLEKLAQAEQIARQLSDKRRLALALHWSGSMHLAMGAASRAVPALAENAQLADELGDERLSVVPRFFAAMEMVEQDPRSAVAQLEHVIALARALQDREFEGHTRGLKAMAHARLGEFVQAREEMERAIEMVTSTVRKVDIDLFSSLAYYAMGESDRGLEYSQRGAEQARDANVFECAVAGFSCVGVGYLDMQDWAKARSAFEEGLRLSQYSGLEDLNNQVRAGLAVAQFFSGQREALPEIETTLANAKAIGNQYFAAFLSLQLSEVYARLEQYDKAEDYLNEALSFYQRNDMRPYLARALRALGDLRLKQDRPEEAQAAYEQAYNVMAELTSYQGTERVGEQLIKSGGPSSAQLR